MKARTERLDETQVRAFYLECAGRSEAATALWVRPAQANRREVHRVDQPKAPSPVRYGRRTPKVVLAH